MLIIKYKMKDNDFYYLFLFLKLLGKFKTEKYQNLYKYIFNKIFNNLYKINLTH